jgi:hypothetical protein
MTKEPELIDLEKWIGNNTDMYLGTLTISAKIVTNLIGRITTQQELIELLNQKISGYQYRLGEGTRADKLGPANTLTSDRANGDNP